MFHTLQFKHLLILFILFLVCVCACLDVEVLEVCQVELINLVFISWHCLSVLQSCSNQAAQMSQKAITEAP